MTKEQQAKKIITVYEKITRHIIIQFEKSFLERSRKRKGKNEFNRKNLCNSCINNNVYKNRLYRKRLGKKER